MILTSCHNVMIPSRFLLYSSLSCGHVRLSLTLSPSTMSYRARIRLCAGPGVRSRMRPAPLRVTMGRSVSRPHCIRTGASACGSRTPPMWPSFTGFRVHRGGPTYGWNGTSGPGGGGGPRRPSNYSSLSPTGAHGFRPSRPTAISIPRCSCTTTGTCHRGAIGSVSGSGRGIAQRPRHDVHGPLRCRPIKRAFFRDRGLTFPQKIPSPEGWRVSAGVGSFRPANLVHALTGTAPRHAG